MWNLLCSVIIFDAHRDLTKISMPFYTRCSDMDACRTGNNRSTRPMTPYHVPTVAETSNMCLWNRTQSSLRATYRNWSEFCGNCPSKKKKDIETATSLHSYFFGGKRNMKRTKKQIFPVCFISECLHKSE